MSRARARTRVTVPEELAATEPPEAGGGERDAARLLVVADRRPVRHRRFRDLPGVLEPGDLLVVNTSATAPAAVDGHRGDGRAVTLHLSGPVPGAPPLLVVELRSPGGERVRDGRAGERIALPRGVVATLHAGYPDPGRTAGSRLWRASIPVEGGLVGWLARVGRPIRYPHVRGSWPLAAYQTVFATEGAAVSDPAGRAVSGEVAEAEVAEVHAGGQRVPGPEMPGGEMPGVEMPGVEMPSAEMPSAGRPFTPRVLAGLRARGVEVTGVVLHTGVSSPEADESPLPERFRVGPAAAAAIMAARRRGGRVVAVGTTATRAVESVAAPDGTLAPGAGWTNLVLGPDRPARVVTGLVTGWHEPDSSHLLLLEAVAGPRLVGRAYAAALRHRYRWHEFGDSCLLLPAPGAGSGAAATGPTGRLDHGTREIRGRRADRTDPEPGAVVAPGDRSSTT